MKPITLEQAKQLKIGTILYHRQAKNADGSPQRWKVTGKVQTWKRDLNMVYIPLKRGKYTYSHLTKMNLWYFSLNDK